MIPYETIVKLRELHNNSLVSKREILIYLIEKIVKWKDSDTKSSEVEKLIDLAREIGISFIKEAINEGMLNEYSLYKGILKFNKPKDTQLIITKIDRLLTSLVAYEEEIKIEESSIKIKKYVPEIHRAFNIDEIFEIMDPSDTYVEFYVGLESSRKSNPAILLSPFPIQPGRTEYIVVRPNEEKIAEVFKNCKSDFLIKLYERIKTKYNFISKVIEQKIIDNDNISAELFAKEIIKSNVYFVVEEDRRFEELVTKNPQTVISILNYLYETFDPLMVDIYLASGIRILKNKDLLGHNAVFVNFDKSNVGKSFLARILGSEPYYKVTVASLLGFSTGKEIKVSIVHNRNDLIVIDELGVEKDRELYGKILELLKSGIAITATGATLLSTRTWSSIIFNANVNKLISGVISEKEKARVLFDYLLKITDNMQGLSSRLSVINFYQFSMPSQRLETSIVETARMIIPSLLTYLGEIYSSIVKKNMDFLDEPWTKENYKKLKDIAEKIEIPELREFILGIHENYFKMNVLAMRMSIVNAYMEKNIQKLFEDRSYLRSLFIDNKKELEKLILSSLNLLAENLEPEDVIINKISKLSEEGKTLLKILAEYFKYTQITESEFTFSYIESSLEEKGIDLRQFTNRSLSSLAQRVIRSKKTKNIFAEFGVIFSKNGLYITSSKLFSNVINVAQKALS